MTDREKKIGEIVEVIRDTIGDYRLNDPYETAEVLYNANYRKMDEVTLKLDLGDRTPEEIKQIAEMFNGEIKKQVAKEIYDFARDFFEWDEEGFCRELADLIKQRYGVGVDK